MRFGTVAKEMRRRVTARASQKFALGLKFLHHRARPESACRQRTLAVPDGGPSDKIPVDNLDAPPGLGSPTVGWALPVCFDFVCYSNMAIGLGLMIGIYFARFISILLYCAVVTEFWRRLHIAFVDWFRDYLYIPLGGSRAGAYRTYFNLLPISFCPGAGTAQNGHSSYVGPFLDFSLFLKEPGLAAVLARIKNRVPAPLCHPGRDGWVGVLPRRPL